MARIDDTQRVFDVSRPQKVGPSATSKPVIVGHRPMMSDPMVKDEQSPGEDSGSKVTSVPVITEDTKPEPTAPATPEEPIFEPVVPKEPPPNEEAEPAGGSSGEHNFTPLSSIIGGDNEKSGPKKEKPEPTPEIAGSDDGSHLVGTLPLPHPPGAGPKRAWKKYLVWLFTLVILAGAGLYLAIDAGLINTGIKLPFSIFGNDSDQESHSTTPASNEHDLAASSQHGMPAGFTMYEVEGTSVSFGYPTAWGTPTLTKDPGFTKRGSSNQSDGSHAYLISFATNKDVEVVLTSAKYLPSPRTALYYDFLQWCVGTNDGKFYKQQLRHSTTENVDMPTTITCDQGPLEDATKMDEQTLVQMDAKDSSGKTLGDLYTKNLNDAEISVLRIKDASMDHSEDIKKLLSTVSTE